MVLGRRMSAAAYLDMYGKDDRAEWAKETDDYMGIVNFGIVPHLNSPEFGIITAAFVEAKTENLDHSIYALDDNSAIAVNGDKTYVVSKGDGWEYFPSE